MSLRHLTPSPRLFLLSLHSPSTLLAPSSSRAFASSPSSRTQPPRPTGPTLRAGPSLSNPPPAGSADTSGDGFGAREHAGPFPLGPRDLDQRLTWGARPKRPTWGELTVKGKVARASQKTGNFAVVAFGGALFFVIVISVSTELFSPNSPTVIFNKAVERLKKSPDLKLYLLPPFAYHPPHSSSTRPSNARARLSSLSSQVSTSPTTGLETHSFVFYIEGAHPGDARSPTGWWGSFRDSTVDRARRGWNDTQDFWDGLADEGWVPSRETISGLVDFSSLTSGGEVAKVEREKKEKERNSSFFGGLFGIKRAEGEKKAGSAGAGLSGLGRRHVPELGTYTTGEVQVVCEKNPQTSILELKQIQVFVPSAATRNAYKFNVPVVDPNAGKGWIATVKGLFETASPEGGQAVAK